MSQKGLALLAVTLFVSVLAVRVPHSSLHLQVKTTPHAIPPIVFTPKSLAAPVSNLNLPSTNQINPVYPSAGVTQQTAAKIQLTSSTQPHAIAPIPYTGGCTNGKVWNNVSLSCVCPADKPYADLSGQCVACPAPLFWVAKLSRCMTCPEGFQSDKIQGRCYCPKDKPFLDSKNTCVACSTIWNYAAKTCLVCEVKKSFNPTSKKCECLAENFEDAAGHCVSCPSPAAWDLKNKKCVRCPQGFTFDQTTSQCTCPKDKPYLDTNNVCQSCNGEWDENTLSCKACKENQTWNATAKKCECQGDNFDDGTGKCVVCPKPAAWDLTNKKCVRCPEGFTFDQKSSQCTCPADKPYLDGNNICQACNTKWDTNALKCEVCLFGTAWNNSTQKCQEKCSYPLVNGKCQCPSDKPALDQATQECKVCDKQTPVWNGKQCKACPPNSYYVASSKTCAICVEGMTFNQISHSCVPV